MIPGLFYYENILNGFELDYFDNFEWDSFGKGRKFKHFGYSYDYKNGNVKKINEQIPQFIFDIKHRIEPLVKQISNKQKINFNQCIINHYLPNHGISKHIDHINFGPIIACGTIGSGTNIIFRKGEESKSLYVEKNSIYIMSDEARYLWTHEIQPKEYDIIDNIKINRDVRVSVTFRDV